jgi:ankyrin repeat protein
MRLLKLQDDNELSLVEFFSNDTPPYAILSHTWGADHEEVTYKDVVDGTGKSKAGYNKIRFCGKQATKHGLHYFWVDTCCIDKSSSSELQEAINSMFRWYQEAARCYVYLSDVAFGNLVGDNEYSNRWEPEFKRSRWFTRGWTLQELIAPKSVEFFSQEEQRLGDKQSMRQTLHDITGISIQALEGRHLSHFSMDERMSWAENRQTKREEDAVYSLLGIFNIYMPLLYGERQDKALVRLKKEIKESMEELPSRTELLNLLYFEQIDDRLMSLQKAHSTTCKWFLYKEQYRAWINAENLSEHHGFLWIKGKPGAGKSILMKFLDSKAKTSAKSDKGALVVSFFFNARGDYLEKSTTGLYRSLLWQIFEKAEDLKEVVDEFDNNAKRIIQRKGWKLEILKETLAKTVERLGYRSLQIFVDALDECDDKDIIDMISFFEDIGERAVDVNVRLHICFSSRHYPTVTIRWGMQIILEDEEEHGNDIARYINSKLKLANLSSADSLRAQVLEKSAGVFLWVALVIPILDEASAKGRVEELQKRLDRIPLGLDNLFEMILTRDLEDMPELRLCVQWILFAKRPLRPEEYFFTIRSPTSPETARCRVSGDVNAEVIRLFVHSSSKGLAEVTKTKSDDKTPTVQFIHESVRDFFLVEKGYQRLWPNHGDRFVAYSHDLLKERCLAEINGSDVRSRFASRSQHKTQLSPTASSQMDIDVLEHKSPAEPLSKVSSLEASTLRRLVSEKFPFLEYAVHHVLYHADAAESDVTKQEIFLQEFPLKIWIRLDTLFPQGTLESHRYTPSASLLYILAEQGLPRLIKHELRRVSHMDIKGERHCFPIFAACASGNQDAIIALLMQETILVKDQNLALQLEYFRNIEPQQSRTPLLYAAEKGNQGIVRLLVETGKVDIDVKNKDGVTPLLWAAKNGHDAVVKQLLETGKVDVDIKDSGYRQTPLWYAARNGHNAVVKLLLETGKVDVDIKDENRRTPLWWAVWRGHNAVVKLLVEMGKVNVDLKDRKGQTPLWWAAMGGHEDVVKLLVETGKVDVNEEDKDGRTPLWWSARSGNEAMVKLLLATGKVDVNVKNKDGQTPLSWAVRRGHVAVVKLLVETGKIDINEEGKYGETLLLLAARNGHEAVVKLLLEMGKVDVNAKDSRRGETPLWWAARYGREAVVKLLLETGKVDVNVKGEDRQTPLLWAASNRHEAIVKLLLETGKVEVDTKDKDGQTPLWWAAWRGHKAVVKLLLEMGKVNVNAKDSRRGETPLWCAARYGREAVVKLLLETGKVDIDVKDSIDGWTPLWCAAANGHEAVVKLLLETDKVDVNMKDKNGNTPLGLAAANGHKAVVELLELYV